MTFLSTLSAKPGPVPVKSPGANKFKNLVGDLFNKGKAVARTEFNKAKTNQVPKLRAELTESFGAIFRQVKARAVETVANTQLAQDVKVAEVKKMTPTIIAVAVVLVIVVYLLARRK